MRGKKDISEFYKHSAMADGHLNKCKECTKIDSNKHRQDNLEKVKEYDRNRPNKEERVEKFREYQGKLKLTDPVLYSKIKYESTKRTRKKFPEKEAARRAVAYAIQTGKLINPYKCEHCLTVCKVEAHHWSYEKENKLDIIWLCDSCHKAEHVKLRKEGRDPDIMA